MAPIVMGVLCGPGGAQWLFHGSINELILHLQTWIIKNPHRTRDKYLFVKVLQHP